MIKKYSVNTRRYLANGPIFSNLYRKKREGINVYFNVNYLKLNKNGKPEFDFTLVPHVQDNPRMGKAPEPATKHYLNRDIYTHVTYADLNIDTITTNKKCVCNC